MAEYCFETVWPSPPAEVQTSAVDFWVGESALSESQAVERAGQLLVVCWNDDGAVVAVTTAVASFIETLGLRCFYFRALVGRAHRVVGAEPGGGHRQHPAQTRIRLH